MNTNRYFTGFLLTILLTLTLLPTTSATAAEQAVQPQKGPPGSVFAFFATGFAAEEWVTYWANDPLGQVYEGGSVRGNQFNRADWTWASPSDAMVGRWAMVARGHESQVERVIFFEVADLLPGQVADMPAGQDSQAYQQAIFPPSGAPGTDFRIFAEGYKRHERVVFWVNDPSGGVHEVGAFGANHNGRVDWVWESPETMEPGQWTLVARGDKSHVERVMSFEIEVPEAYPEMAAPVDSYDIAVSPARGAAGELFRFFATNFDEGETVHYEIVAPDGSVHAEGTTHATYARRVDWTWKSPYDAMAGTWTAQARGAESHVERMVTFTIFHHTPEATTPSQRTPYDSAVYPASARAGSEFAFFATGYTYEEYVRYQCITPSGVVHTSGSVKSNERGRADWTCQTPYEAEAGVWSAVAEGKRSDVAHVIHFTVTP